MNPCLGEALDCDEDQRCDTTSDNAELVMEIVNPSAFVLSVDSSLMELGHSSFNVRQRSADECGAPHPEQSTGAAEADSCSDTDDVAGTDTSCDCQCERLERGKSVIGFFAVKEQFDHCWDFTNLREPHRNRHNKTDTENQDQHAVSPEKTVQCSYHCNTSFLLRDKL